MNVGASEKQTPNYSYLLSVGTEISVNTTQIPSLWAYRKFHVFPNFISQ
jgi:hypothetical protein